MRLVIGLFSTLLLSIFSAAQQKPLSLIPYPVEVKQQEGVFLLKNKITVSSSLPQQDWKPLFSYFKNEMKKLYNISVTEAAKGKQADISFQMRRMPTSGKPAYELKVNKNGVTITSNFSEPTFHAMQTFFQLISVDNGSKKEMPFVEIFDHARFNYRGLHLDVGRHFFPVSFIKKYIDYLAYHKLNTFHWHLTEDQGWRIEIKKYPKLTSVGGWRNGTIIGRYPGTGNDGIKYGGFYTQEQIKEIVKYASDRYITVIPEIEMPGHSSAAIAAYPDLSCFPDKSTEYPKECAWSGPTAGKQVQQTWGVFDDVFCAGKENTFKFLEDVMDEVLALFPSKYIHVGGDESPKAHWKLCPACQQRMKDNGLKDEHELQSYFIQRMEKYLNKKGRTLIGWDEILEGGLAPNAVVMSWRGEQGGIDAAKQNHDVIMTPGNPVYFDHSQSENEDSVTIGGYNPIEKVYAYEPVPKELNDEQAKHVLGAQANMWTEYMKNTNKVEYMLFPRIAALSEVLWSKKENKNWDDFQKRLTTQFKRYDLWKVNYSKAYLALKATVLATDDNKGLLWKLENKNKSSQIRYNKTLDITDPPNPPAFQTYSSPVLIVKSGKYSGWSMEDGKSMQNTITQNFSFNKATGKKISLTNPISDKYPGDGAFTLVNGVQNEKGFARSKEFIAFNGTDCEAIIDLGNSQSISSVTIHALTRQTSWIWQPRSAEVFGSADGKSFTSLGTNKDFIQSKNPSGNGLMNIDFNVTSVRYIKVVVKNWGAIPDGNAGAGNKAWLFVDEIEIN